MPALHLTLYDWSPQPGPVLSGYGTGIWPQFVQDFKAKMHIVYDENISTMNIKSGDILISIERNNEIEHLT